MTLILAYRSRGRTINIVIQDANGDPIIPGGNDEVRARIGREGKTPELIVDSSAATANGSSFTKATVGNPNVLRLDASDLEFDAGTYTMFVDYFDNADGQEWKNVDRQVFHLEGSPSS
jgi:hypothetical protein